MRFGSLNILISAIVLFALAGAAVAGAEELAPFKDRLFAYPATIASELGGEYRIVDYRELRDINGRDQIPEKRVKSPYVDLSVRRAQTAGAVESAAGTVSYLAAGRLDGASIITIYLHGQGGNARQGMNDFTFGGNFNRIKNLMVRNGGLYISPDFADFGANGEIMIAALIEHFAKRSPGAKIFVACGSMGGFLCWRLTEDGKAAATISGYLLLGSMWHPEFLRSAAFRRETPLFFGQGSHDTVFAIERQEAFFRSIVAAKPDYPVRFVRFETGTHGTPIRMVDWRAELNWMLSVRAK